METLGEKRGYVRTGTSGAEDLDGGHTGPGNTAAPTDLVLAGPQPGVLQDVEPPFLPPTAGRNHPFVEKRVYEQLCEVSMLTLSLSLRAHDLATDSNNIGLTSTAPHSRETCPGLPLHGSSFF